MLRISKSIKEEWSANNTSIDEKANYLLGKFLAKDIAKAYLELLDEKAKTTPTKKEKKVKKPAILISQAQFDEHFKIRKSKAK